MMRSVPGRLWKFALSRTPYGRLALPASLNCVWSGTSDSDWSQNRQLFGSATSHVLASVRPVDVPPRNVNTRHRPFTVTSTPRYHVTLLSEFVSYSSTRPNLAGERL